MHQVADTGGEITQRIRCGNATFGIQRFHGVNVIVPGAFVLRVARDNRLQRLEIKTGYWRFETGRRQSIYLLLN